MTTARDVIAETLRGYMPEGAPHGEVADKIILALSAHDFTILDADGSVETPEAVSDYLASVSPLFAAIRDKSP